MTDESPAVTSAGGQRFQRVFLLLLVAAISLLFLAMVRGFLMSVLLAAIFAGMARPFYIWILQRIGGHREGWAAIIVVLVLFFGVALPLSAFFVVVANESVQLSQGAQTWVKTQSGLLERVRTWLEQLPFSERFLPARGRMVEEISALAGRAGPVLMGTLAAATRGTLSFILHLFIMLYAMFFFLVDGPKTLRTILYYIPLGNRQEGQLLGRFISVTRATLKGSLLIGILQGLLAGVAFWVSGVPGAAFWGTVMVVLSIIPAVGAFLVWVPAVIFLFVSGSTTAALGLLAWCAIVVSTVDNFLRPRLVGRDAKMSDLLILLSTLGGITFFGAVGFIVGPIVAALFVTIWHIYGDVFHQWLPTVTAGPLIPKPTPEYPHPAYPIAAATPHPPAQLSAEPAPPSERRTP